MRKPIVAVVGVVLALFGLVFALQGFGVLEGSAMSDTVLWSVLGPIIVIVGLALVVVGVRGKLR
ncbi:hypothetical protein ASG12_18680 [Williamsia sp. Leaf354]|jgi:hypothetical protein|uniref:Integral membrane protein n=1 Tax=Williamsia herbipolensis TaxID=1603258 RepID=A0AAU4K748_9NOCA|nr:MULTISPECIES: hypothetical protein [Williamsia]KQR96662.1 hypothetical protein ASG12_18680 [Williamsia sp. Leaf354]MCX6469592.1 hypothetical protein [Mycobacteriales bacterium]